MRPHACGRLLKFRIKNFLAIGEKETFAEILEIIRLAKKANASLSKMLEKPDRDTLEIENEDVRLLEKKADEITFKIKGDIENGAISSNILDNLLACVDAADSIVDNCYYVSRELNRMAGLRLDGDRSEHTAGLDASLTKMLKLAADALTMLETSLTSDGLEKILELRTDVQRIEEEGDNIKDAGFDKLYAIAPLVHYLQFMHFSELLHKFDDILDACEDISDLIVTITTSISR